MRFRDIVALIALIIIALGGQIFRSEDPAPSPPRSDTPRRPAPQAYAEPPKPGRIWMAETESWLSEAPSRRTGVAPNWGTPEGKSVVELPYRRSSGSGTAFAVGDGKWLTARHVTDGCDDIGLQIAPRKGIKVTDVRNHPNADVALLTTRGSPAPFPLGPGADKGDDGYMIGFPQGRPGAVHVTKIGSTVLHERGRYKTRERADVWSERSRIPDRFGSLGGLSGGPAFTADGQLSGVVLAEEPRRGRVLSAEPQTLARMIEDVGHIGTTQPAGPLSRDGYPRTAREMITSLRIAKVLCRVR